MKSLAKKLPAIILTALLFSLGTGCKKSDNSNPPTAAAPSNPATNEVVMQNTMFSPATIRVAVNTTVKWTNNDNTEHTVTSDTGLFDSGNIADGGTFSRQFPTAGTYAYHCKLHSGMTGTVIVQ